jgi:hypothetical protein
MLLDMYAGQMMLMISLLNIDKLWNVSMFLNICMNG